MSRLLRSLDGSGQLLLRGGDALSGRYHIDVVYFPVRRVEEIRGRFVLNDAPGWESVVEAQFAGDAKIALGEGREIPVTLGGIVGSEVAVVGAALPPDDRNSRAGTPA